MSRRGDPEARPLAQVEARLAAVRREVVGQVELLLHELTEGDPRILLTSEFVEHFLGAKVNPGLMILRMIVLALVGGFLAFLAKSAPRTIQDAVALEVAHMEIKNPTALVFFNPGVEAGQLAFVAVVLPASRMIRKWRHRPSSWVELSLGFSGHARHDLVFPPAPDRRGALMPPLVQSSSG